MVQRSQDAAVLGLDQLLLQWRQQPAVLAVLQLRPGPESGLRFELHFQLQPLVSGQLHGAAESLLAPIPQQLQRRRLHVVLHDAWPGVAVSAQADHNHRERPAQWSQQPDASDPDPVAQVQQLLGVQSQLWLLGHHKSLYSTASHCHKYGGH